MVKPPPTSFPALLGLRAVVASLVFVYHYYGNQDTNPTYTQIFINLNYRMTIFFVLSGFGVMMSFLPRTRLSKKEYFRFLYRRFIRLFPLYLVLLVIPYFQVGFPAWPILLANLTLAKGFFQQIMLSGIAPAWSLSVEITFYLVAPLILRTLCSGPKLIKGYITIVFVGLSLAGAGYLAQESGYNTYGFLADFSFVTNYTFFGRATDFYAGCLLAGLLSKYPDIKIPRLWLGLKNTYLALILVFLTSYSEYYLKNLTTTIGAVLDFLCLHLVLPLVVAYFIYALIREKTVLRWFLSSKGMLVLGSSSYGFYLMHLSWVEYKLSKINPLPDQSFVLLWLTAILGYYLFEKPVLLFFRKRFFAG